MTNQDLKKKTPVIVVLGHVDAGKSSILDFIRRSNIVEKESGGITQHVGVYGAEIKGQKVTLVDTPGHAAFSGIRSRGAKIADLVILVVAADQGIQPQTKEAISYLKETKLPTIVAFNKIDVSSEKINAIKGQLNKAGLTVESMGGSVPALEISAKKGTGMDALLDMILLMVEMEELKAEIKGVSRGIIIEARQDSRRGSMATIIVDQGVLKSGDVVGTPSSFGRIKGLFDPDENPVKQVEPGEAAIIFGLNQVPQVGEWFQVYRDIGEAATQAKEELSSRLNMAEDGYNVIIKADVQSSLEAIQAVLREIHQAKVKINIVEARTGKVTQNDVNLAQTTGAEIIGFNVGLSSGAGALLDKAAVRFKNFDLIYDLTEHVAEGLKKRRKLEPARREVGKLEVLAIFKTEKNRQIIGGNVISGQIEKNAKLDVFRGKEKIGQGNIITLECRKKKAEVVPRGQQAGILYEGTGRIAEGDLIEAYFINMV